MAAPAILDIAASSPSDVTLVNSNFSSIRNVANDLDAGNLNAAAALAVTKLAAGADGTALVNLSGSRQWKPSMIKLAGTVLGAPAASITFSNIPGSYFALMIVGIARNDDATFPDYLQLQLNDDTGGNYFEDESTHNVTGNNRAESNGISYWPLTNIPCAGDTANHFAAFRTWIPFYAQGTNRKTAFSDGLHSRTAVAGAALGQLGSDHEDGFLHRQRDEKPCRRNRRLPVRGRMTVIVTTTIPIGSAGSAIPINANFAAIKAAVNGNLDNGNVADNAGIAPTQIALGPSEGSILASNSGACEWRSGMLLINQVTLIADTATMDITSIPGDYQTLVAYVFARGDNASAGSEECRLRFNNDSGANYSTQINVTDGNVQASSEVVGATGAPFAYIPKNSALANAYGTAEIWIPQYTGTTRKTFLSISSNGVSTAAQGVQGVIMGGVWASTSAITRITLLPVTSTNFKAGSFFRLYGIT